MKKTKILFVLFVLGLLVVPWFDLPQASMTGWEQATARPEFSWKSFQDKGFQQQMEKWWTRHFGLRNTMFVTKNTIYEVLNLGQFHSGYGGNILQGRHGVLYERAYLFVKYAPGSKTDIEKNVAETVDVFTRLRDRLEAMGKTFIFIMAPSKADCREESLPRLWQFRQKHVETPPSILPIWEKALRQNKILYVNSLEVIKKKGILKDSFPDPGTHWSLLAAGITWEEAVRTIRRTDAGIPAVRVSGMQISTEARAEERDIANLLDIRPRYRRGKQSWKCALFDPVPCDKAVSTIIVGDSFSVQLTRNIIRSGFSSIDHAHNFGNILPTKEQWFEFLDKTNVVILIYTYPNLTSTRVQSEAKQLLAYTDDVLLKNWNGYEEGWQGQWSKDRSLIEFYSGANNDLNISFRLVNSLRAKKVDIALNGIKVEEFDFSKTPAPFDAHILLPGENLHPGLNRIEFHVEGAGSPVTWNAPNQDIRLLGVFCSGFSISRSSQ